MRRKKAEYKKPFIICPHPNCGKKEKKTGGTQIYCVEHQGHKSRKKSNLKKNKKIVHKLDPEIDKDDPLYELYIESKQRKESAQYTKITKFMWG